MLKKSISISLILLITLLSIIVSNASCSMSSPVENNRFVELLTLLPASAKNGGRVVLIDYERILNEYGVSLYTPDNQTKTREELSDNLMAAAKEKQISGINVWLLGSHYTGWSRSMLISTIQTEYVGYDATYVDAEINNINLLPQRGLEELDFDPDLMVAAIGRYDPQATSDALSNKDEWPSWVIEQFAIENHRNIPIYSWHNGTEGYFKDSFSPPHLDIQGVARPFAVSVGHLFTANDVKVVSSMIDAYLDKAPNLADVPEYALAAQWMFDLGVFGATISDHTLANNYMYSLAPSITPKLKKFLTYSTGGGIDEQGGFIALVIVHDNSHLAEENVSLLEQRIANTLQQSEELSGLIHNTKIRLEGRVIISKIYTNSETLWGGIIESYGLLIHEED